VACFALFYLATAFALSQGAGPLGYNRQSFLGVQLAANVFLTAGIVVSAIWSDRSTPGRVLAWGAGLGALVGLFFWAGLSSGSLPTVFVTLSVALFVMGLTYGPLSNWLAELFPCRCAIRACRWPSMRAASSGAPSRRVWRRHWWPRGWATPSG
jgi:hypothetical protein